MKGPAEKAAAEKAAAERAGGHSFFPLTNGGEPGSHLYLSILVDWNEVGLL